jgi:hypothetical protein
VWLVSQQVFDQYDIFLSYRWGLEDSQLTQKLFDHLTLFTVTMYHRSIIAFLDTYRLKDGSNFQKQFARALVHSTVVCPLVTPHALRRMENHDPTKEDNLVVEWLCAARRGVARVGCDACCPSSEESNRQMDH